VETSEVDTAQSPGGRAVDAAGACPWLECETVHQACAEGLALGVRMEIPEEIDAKVTVESTPARPMQGACKVDDRLSM